jgi:hypothetical protein
MPMYILCQFVYKIRLKASQQRSMGSLGPQAHHCALTLEVTIEMYFHFDFSFR